MNSLDNNEATRAYANARRTGLKEYEKYIAEGRIGYLPFLDGVLKNTNIVSENDLGIKEIPLKKIKGTYTYNRSISFSKNFMPILGIETEFATKWKSVYQIQQNEGLRDAVKVYEYLNWYYVIEGNKRISVLKFINLYSFPCKVIRLMPKYDKNDKTICLYYEYVDFYNKTGINSIWFSEIGRFEVLYNIIKNYTSSSKLFIEEDKYKLFNSSVYLNFENAYKELGGERYSITTGDALLEYIKVYGLPEYIIPKDIKANLKRFMTELDYYDREKPIRTKIEDNLDEEGNILTKITSKLRNESLKVGFIYRGDFKNSSWNYAHELGRSHLKNVLKSQIKTDVICNVKEGEEAFESYEKLVKKGCKVIFSTNNGLINSALKAALEFPDTIILNCSGDHSFRHLNTYFGKLYEPRFLSGVLAGVLTKSSKIGYIASYAIPEVISGLNAFTLGARMVNSRAIIEVKFIESWDDQELSRNAGIELAEAGSDIICHHNALSNKEETGDYGLFSILYDEKKRKYIPNEYIATHIWNWGVFYEKIIRNILTGTYKSSANSSQRQTRNYMWGMDTGVIDFFYSKRIVPRETQKLIKMTREAISNHSHSVFTGPIYDRDGNIRIEEDECADREMVIRMDWLVEGVIGNLPEAPDMGHTLQTGKINEKNK